MINIVWLVPRSVILLLRNPENASTALSMNGKTDLPATSLPFVPSINSGQALRFSKNQRKVFRQNYSPLRFAAPRAFRFSGRVIIALIAALLPLSPVSTFGQSLLPAKLQKVTALYGARSGASWPMWMAKQGGYYRKHDLEVELVFGVHPAPIAAVISGQAAMTPAGADPALLSISKDSSLVLVGSYLNKGSFALVAGKNIKQISQLAGKRVGVGRVGDPPYHFTLSLLRKHGINTKDIQWLSVGVDAAARAASLHSGQIDATLITAPAYFRLEAAGFPVLAVLSDYEDIFVSTYYLFRRETVLTNRLVAEGFIKAHAEAIKRFYGDRTFAMQVMMKYGGAKDVEDASRVYNLFAKSRMFEPIPYVLKGSVEGVIERQRQEQPYLKDFDFSKSVDNSLVEQLAREGFFERLFGPEIREEQRKKQALAYGR
ncbi:MAG TPA: ABC transporter substrate-binding protein [Candidatus Binatia bacterium]|jgi:ABC-type nitrate/sulfonate/bicarbonate transport system substrate-binding protein|nr:ABC transporter substrate-binding protein [Candidatus Binatia bacterium]